MRFAKNTQHDTSGVLRLPRKMRSEVSKMLRLPRKMQHISWKRCKSIAPATQNDFWHVMKHCWNVTKCHACHANRHDSLFWNIQRRWVLQLPPHHRSQRLETRHVGASKRAFRARLPQISHFAASKSTFSYAFSYEPTSKSTFRARLPSIFITCHKMPRLPLNLHLVTTSRSADNAIRKNTQHDTSKVLRLPRKTRTLANGCGRLRTVANVNATPANTALPPHPQSETGTRATHSGKIVTCLKIGILLPRASTSLHRWRYDLSVCEFCVCSVINSATKTHATTSPATALHTTCLYL